MIRETGECKVGDHWYDAFADAGNTGAKRRGSLPRRRLRGGNGSAQGRPPVQGGFQMTERILDRLIGDHDVPSGALKLQSCALAQLSDSNRRLLDRIETLLLIQEREQVLRQQLQNQVDRLSERIPEGSMALPETHQAVSDAVVKELKPVLMAMLDLFERCVPGTQAEPGSKPPAPQRWASSPRSLAT